MDQARLHEGRQIRRLAMDEFFQGVEAGGEFIDGRRNVERVAQARATDPVLRATKIPGTLRLASTTSQHPFMHFPN